LILIDFNLVSGRSRIELLLNHSPIYLRLVLYAHRRAAHCVHPIHIGLLFWVEIVWIEQNA